MGDIFKKHYGISKEIVYSRKERSRRDQKDLTWDSVNSQEASSPAKWLRQSRAME
jgi:hypothetical protein